MKRLAVYLIAIILILSVVSCMRGPDRSSLPTGPATANAVIEEPKETAEEKETRLAEESAKAKEEFVRKLKIRQATNNSIVKCSKIKDEYNNTFCFAEEGVKIIKTYGRITGVLTVQELCDQSENSDICYFFAAVALKAPGYCKNVEDRTGCELLSNARYCPTMVNPNSCLVDKAFLIRYVSKDAAKQTCDSMEKFKAYPYADQFNCDDINFGTEDYDSEPLRDRFLTMYFVSGLMGFEVTETTINDYIREMETENGQE